MSEGGPEGGGREGKEADHGREEAEALLRLTRSERASIERELGKRRPSARDVARDLGRSPASISDEAKRNRTVARGPGKGERAGDAPEDACARLQAWPWTCNGCQHRRYGCGKALRCEYSAARAQTLADGLLSGARRGVNAKEYDFERAMATIRSDVARGLSPAQIACGRADRFKVHPTTIYRWIAAGYAGMSDAELRRKVGYKPRREPSAAKPTSHGPERSYKAFSALPEEGRARALPRWTRSSGCPRTRSASSPSTRSPARVQVCLLLPEKTSSAVAAALDMLERAIGKPLFQRLFGLVLTDNGCEFSDTEALERSAFHGTARTKVYYCDVRASQQKGGCERNHVELRKLLPKGRGISFDDLDGRDLAVVMSQLNSEPRPSLMGLSPTAMLEAADPEAAAALMDALGIEEVPYEKLDLTIGAVDRSRRERGLPPLA